MISDNPDSGFRIKVVPQDSQKVGWELAPIGEHHPWCGGTLAYNGRMEFSFNAGVVVLDGTAGLNKLHTALVEVVREAERLLEVQPGSI